MKRLFLALAALLALSQPAFALGETKGLGNIFGGAATSTGEVDIVGTKGADNTCSRDSLTAIKSAVVGSFNKAVAAQDNYQTDPLFLRDGCYKVGSAAGSSETAAIDLYPSIKLHATNHAKIDGRQAPLGTRFFRINAGAWPYTTSETAMGQAAAAFGFPLENIHIYGRAGDPSSVGVSIGSVTSTAVVERSTRAGIKGGHIQEVGVGIEFQPWSVYLNRFEDVTIRSPYYACINFVDSGDGTANNSGEDMVFDRGVCSGGQVVGTSYGLIYGTSARNMTFNGWSFDFNRVSAMHIPELPGAAGYGQVTFNHPHLEGNTFVLTSSETQPFFMHVTYNDAYLFPGATRPGSAAVNYFDRAYWNASGIKVSINKMYVGLTGGVYSGVSGLWLMSSPTIPDIITGIDYQNQRVLVHQNFVPNFNWNFPSSTIGQFKFDQTAGYYVKNQSAGLNIEVEASGTVPEFGASANRLKLTPTGNNFVDLLSDAFTVVPNARLFGWPVVYGGDTSSTLTVAQNILWLMEKRKPDVSVTLVTKSTNNLTITTPVDHQVDSNTLVGFLNVANAEYVGKQFAVFSVTSQTMRLQVSGTYPLPVAVTGTTLAIRPEQVTVAGGTPIVTSDISSSVYGNSADGAYQGGARTWWAQTNVNRTANTTNDIRVPQGVTKARMLWTLTTNAAAPSWWVFPMNLIP